MMTPEEKQAILDKREFHEDLYYSILAATIEKMESSPYCRRILAGANYKKERPENFDLFGFHLEKIYIGVTNGPSGHCTKEKYDREESDVNPENSTRDAVFVAQQVVEKIIEKTKNTDLAAQMLLNEVAHECSHGNQAQKRKWPAQETHAVNLENPVENDRLEEMLRSYYIDLYAKAELSDERAAKYPKIYNQEALKEQNDEMRQQVEKFFKGNLPEKEINERIDLYKETFMAGGYVSQGRQLSEKETIDGWTEDAIDEAGVMADSWIALLSVQPQAQAVEYAADELYKSRINQNAMEVLNPLSETEYAAMFEVDAKGNYTKNAVKMQQQKGREIFTAILAEMPYQNLRRKLEKDAAPNYNTYKTIISLVASYQERAFGSPEQYIGAIKSACDKGNGTVKATLTEESQMMLLLFIKNPDILKAIQKEENGEEIFNNIVSDNKTTKKFINSVNAITTQSNQIATISQVLNKKRER